MPQTLLYPSQLWASHFYNTPFVFRPIEEHDLPLLFVWRTSPSISHYLSASPPKNIAQQYQWFNQLKGGNSAVYYLISRKSTPIGYSQLSSINWNTGTAEAGIVLDHQITNERGLGRKAYLSLLEFSFTHLGLETIITNTHQENTAARNLVEGFVGGRLITTPHPYRKGDELLFELRKLDFNQLKQRLLRADPQWKNLLTVNVGTHEL